MSLSVLAAASVTSLTALLIAFAAYPWQKRKDRELIVGTEARTLVKDFIEVLQAAFFEISETNEMTHETHIKINKTLHCLHLYIEEEDILLARDYLSEHLDWAKKRYEVDQMHNPDELHIIMHGSDVAAKAFLERIKLRYALPKSKGKIRVSGIEVRHPKT